MLKEKLNKFINEFDLYIGAVLLFCMLVLLTLQVVTRYVFRFSFTWTEELATIMFIWLAYFGASSAVLKRQHLRIDLCINMLKGKAKKVAYILTDLITMGFLLYMVKPLLNVIEKLTIQGTVTLLLRVPKNVIYSAIPFCYILMIIRFIQEIYKIITTPEQEEIAIKGKTIFDDYDFDDSHTIDEEDM